LLEAFAKVQCFHGSQGSINIFLNCNNIIRPPSLPNLVSEKEAQAGDVGSMESLEKQLSMHRTVCWSTGVTQ